MTNIDKDYHCNKNYSAEKIFMVYTQYIKYFDRENKYMLDIVYIII